MKNKFSIISLIVSFSIFTPAFAQEGQEGENFSKHKANIISHLNQAKSAIEQEISCVNSAQKRQDAKKCHEAKKEVMEKLHQQKINQRKEHLKEQLRKLDEKSNRTSKERNRD